MAVLTIVVLAGMRIKATDALSRSLYVLGVPSPQLLSMAHRFHS